MQIWSDYLKFCFTTFRNVLQLCEFEAIIIFIIFITFITMLSLKKIYYQKIKKEKKENVILVIFNLITHNSCQINELKGKNKYYGYNIDFSKEFNLSLCFKYHNKFNRLGKKKDNIQTEPAETTIYSPSFLTKIPSSLSTKVPSSLTKISSLSSTREPPSSSIRILSSSTRVLSSSPTRMLSSSSTRSSSVILLVDEELN